MEKENKRYIIRDKLFDNEIESFDDYNKALERLKEYIAIDKELGIYVENSYEIYDSVNKTILIIM